MSKAEHSDCPINAVRVRITTHKCHRGLRWPLLLARASVGKPCVPSGTSSPNIHARSSVQSCHYWVITATQTCAIASSCETKHPGMYNYPKSITFSDIFSRIHCIRPYRPRLSGCVSIFPQAGYLLCWLGSYFMQELSKTDPQYLKLRGDTYLWPYNAVCACPEHSTHPSASHSPPHQPPYECCHLMYSTTRHGQCMDELRWSSRMCMHNYHANYNPYQYWFEIGSRS